jgi:hypothetical protein
MSPGKEKLIPIIAMSFLLIGILSTLYVHGSQVSKETITLVGKEYTINQLFSLGSLRTIHTDEGVKTGVALDTLLIATTDLGCLSCHDYTFKARDGYQQTVDWELMKNGVLTNYRRVYFAGAAHALWVRDVIEMEVN